MDTVRAQLPHMRAKHMNNCNVPVPHHECCRANGLTNRIRHTVHRFEQELGEDEDFFAPTKMQPAVTARMRFCWFLYSRMMSSLLNLRQRQTGVMLRLDV